MKPSDLLAELRPVAHEVLRREPVGELREHLGELGVDRPAVVALHEVLDDLLPVRRDVVGDPPAQPQVGDLVADDRVGRAEPGGDVGDDRVREGRRLVGEAEPHVAQPLVHGDAVQAERGAVDVGHPGDVGCGHQRAVETVGPRVVRALEGPTHRPGLLGAQPRATVAAHVEVRVHAPVAAPRHDHALAPDVDGLEVARAREVRREHRGEPPRLEDQRLFGREDRGIGVPPPRQRLSQARGQLLVRGGRGELAGGHRWNTPGAGSA